MDYVFLTGLVGSFVLITGAAWPEIKDVKHPAKSLKNWLFAISGLGLIIIALFSYFEPSAKPGFYCNAYNLAANGSSLLAVSVSDTASSRVRHSRTNCTHFVTKPGFAEGSFEASWIFFWLNIFFAIFSGYYVVKGLVRQRVYG